MPASFQLAYAPPGIAGAQRTKFEAQLIEFLSGVPIEMRKRRLDVRSLDEAGEVRTPGPAP
jgi:hypothetical protein